jgi:3-deoxy-D-manno-octulosonic-acid transferase
MLWRLLAMYVTYTILYAVVLLITLPFWVVQMLRAGKYRAGLGERLGRVPQRLRLPQENEHSIWIHAVSLGEVLAISGIVAGLQSEFPDRKIFVSTTTLTGQTLARQRFGAQNVFYLPLDLPFAINPYLRAINPRMLILAETEFWPNLLRLAKQSGARIAVVNARISDRSLPGYARFRTLLSRVLSNIDLLLAQTHSDRDRLIHIGVANDRVSVSGNLKFDTRVPTESSLSHALRKVLGAGQSVLVFGSTVNEEEELLVPCFKSVFNEYSDALIILAPRHPERFDVVADMLRTCGLSFWRRSTWNLAPISGGVLLLDTVGELASMYSVADLAFVGGSLVPRGGHNVLEPAQFAKAILVGQHTENFREIVRVFQENHAIRVVTPETLTPTVLQLLASPEEAAQLGSRAISVVEAGRGSTQRTTDALASLLRQSNFIAHQLSTMHG